MHQEQTVIFPCRTYVGMPHLAALLPLPLAAASAADFAGLAPPGPAASTLPSGAAAEAA